MVGVLKWRNCSDKEFGEILNKSNNWTHFLKNCGYRNTGNKKSVMRRIKKLNLDYSHLYEWKPQNRKYSDEELFVENSSYTNRKRIKERLKKTYKWEHKCNNCKLSKWLGKDIPLELEHKNGINNDNRLENLEFLCPNCHAFTPTYRSKNNKKNNLIINM